MKSTLPASHLIRHFLVFTLTVVFLLTMTRSAYALWQFPKLEEADAFVALFVQGLRFDLAVVGIVCIIPVILGFTLAVLKATKGVAKFIVSLFLISSVLLILLLELITPFFIDKDGLRPDLALIAGVDSPAETFMTVVREQAIPLAIAVLLVVLIFSAFWARMELSRMLRYRLAALPSLLTALVGGALCLLAIWSTPDLRKPPLSPVDAQISEIDTVNDLAMNTTFKVLYSLAEPYLPETTQSDSSAN